MNDRLIQAKIQQAEAKIKTCKIARDAAYDLLVKAQRAGAGPDRRQRLGVAYDRAEAEARDLKRKAAGLEASRGIIVDLTESSPLTSAGRRAGWGEGSASAPWAAKVR